MLILENKAHIGGRLSVILEEHKWEWGTVFSIPCHYKSACRKNPREHIHGSGIIPVILSDFPVRFSRDPDAAEELFPLSDRAGTCAYCPKTCTSARLR